MNNSTLAAVSLCCLLGLSLPSAGQRPSDDNESFLQEMARLEKAGAYEQALRLLDGQLASNTNDARLHFIRGRIREKRRQFAGATADFTRAIELEPRASQAWHLRGVAHFKAGDFRRAVADFDRFLELSPEQAPHHWQRGIAHYYAGMFDAGRRQFELHQKVNPSDVENTVWHYLCRAKLTSPVEAQKQLLDVGPDPRVPMGEILKLFAGKGNESEVLEAANRVSGHRRTEAQFYAHLYLGLYWEAQGQPEKARIFLSQAVEMKLTDHYMWDVARVHPLLKQDATRQKGAGPPVCGREIQSLLEGTFGAGKSGEHGGT